MHRGTTDTLQRCCTMIDGWILSMYVHAESISQMNWYYALGIIPTPTILRATRPRTQADGSYQQLFTTRGFDESLLYRIYMCVYLFCVCIDPSSTTSFPYLEY